MKIDSKPSSRAVSRPTPPAARLLAVLGAAFLALAAQPDAAAAPVPKWSRFELSLASAKNYANPIQDAELNAVFVSPQGERHATYGFWDGGSVWRVRFAPNQTGSWTWQTTCTDPSNTGLHNQSGSFQVSEPAGQTRFDLHGPVRVARDGRFFEHEDRTPFFFLADTAWNGALLSTDDDWTHYIGERVRQKFSAVQWVATQWRASPGGDRNQQPAFTGDAKIAVNAGFFQRLDAKIEALNRAGLLSVPVMLWAINAGSNPKVNPGQSLPEDQAVRLARYMVARWDAMQVMWILPGDSDYRGGKADRWKTIGREVFGKIAHKPVTLHPGGRQWYFNEFHNEPWVGFVSYQSGHGDSEDTLRWIQAGPMTEDWWKLPNKPFVNLEPAYENHVAYNSKKPHTADAVRRAMYWSLLNAPTAGIGYGGHGVWGWDDGTKEPTDHSGTGIPMAWKDALKMPGAEQMAHVYDLFTSIPFQRLRPAPLIVVNQPGATNATQFIIAAKTDQKDLTVAYIPEVRTVEIKLDALPASPNITWFNPRTGEKSPAVAVVTANTCQFPTPAEGDWILLMQSETKTDAGKPGE